ncbi:MAG: C40 family peptidase [Elusimicrobia bacterium]|nr:C40 family peptidase [Elusimicrobiota bacterium]
MKNLILSSFIGLAGTGLVQGQTPADPPEVAPAVSGSGQAWEEGVRFISQAWTDVLSAVTLMDSPAEGGQAPVNLEVAGIETPAAPQDLIAFDTQESGSDSADAMMKLTQKMKSVGKTYFLPLPVPEFVGLAKGDRDKKPHGPVSRVKWALKQWNGRLPLHQNSNWGVYDEDLVMALTLFKAVYGLGQDGHSIDSQTAAYLGSLESKSFAKLSLPPKSIGQSVLYAASQFLGVPYILGGDGRKSTDCAMLTRMAVICALPHMGAANLIGANFTRMADIQYQMAKGNILLSLRKGSGNPKGGPKPGDLVFFNNPTSQSGEAVDGVTHVGLYVGQGGLKTGGYILVASYSRGQVILDRMTEEDYLYGYIVGYGYIPEFKIMAVRKKSPKAQPGRK